MTKATRKRIENIIRDARSKVFDDESRYGPIIERAKALMNPVWESD
jgi:hypothetical protein